VKTSAKQGIAIGFLTLMFIKAWVMPLLYLDYELRKEFIIDNFCVNKNRPELHCDGKCYLATRLAAVQEQEEQQAQRAFMFKLLENITDCHTFFVAFQAPEATDISLAHTRFAYTSPFLINAAIADIFHPPQAA
jgi:hypothetical protein